MGGEELLGNGLAREGAGAGRGRAGKGWRGEELHGEGLGGKGWRGGRAGRGR
jgi:hypothetical protein